MIFKIRPRLFRSRLGADWRPDFVSWPRRDYQTGETIRGPVMVRNLGGRRQYRHMTAAELASFLEVEAW